MGNILELTKYQPQNPQARKMWGWAGCDSTGLGTGVTAVGWVQVWQHGAHPTRAVPHLQSGVAQRGQLWDWPQPEPALHGRIQWPILAEGCCPADRELFLSHQESFQAFPESMTTMGSEMGRDPVPSSPLSCARPT